MSQTLVEERRIQRLVKKAVASSLREIFSDPDFGLELQGWVKKRLAKKPGKTISSQELRKRYL